VQIPDDLRAGALVELGMHATTVGDFTSAGSVVEEALAIYRRLDDRVGAAICLFNLARIANWQGDPEEAAYFLEQAIDPLREANDSALTMVLGNLGLALRRSGKLERAAAMLAEGLALGEERGDLWACFVILKEQAALELERGDRPRARQALRRALLLNQELADPRYLAQALEVRAWLAAVEGAAERTACLLGVATRLRASIGVSFIASVQRDYDRYIPAARALIGDVEWERAWEEGQTLSQDDAVALALDGLE
jgi:non-specific serine/threonine protein kinase